MPSPRLDPKVLAFYEGRYDEDVRLSRTPHGRLEFLRTQQLLRRHLPEPPAVIADIGGGTGAHARWLAVDGYNMHLVDPVPKHVQMAAALPGVKAVIGDARALAICQNGVDATLLMGPLYHLTAAADRLKALSEAARITRPGGPVIVAAINRYAWLLELSAQGELSEQTEGEVRDLLATGINDDQPDGFTNAYFHHPEELEAEMRNAGFSEITVYGLEGPSAPALDAAGIDQIEQLLPSAVRGAALVETDCRLINTSPHFLAVAVTPSTAVTP